MPTTKRRGRTEGSIFYKTSTARWIARVELEAGPDGKRTRREYRGKTRAEVRAKLDAARKLVAEKQPLPDDRQTLGSFLTKWLETTAKPSVRPSTYYRYEGIVRLQVVPYLGTRALGRLSGQDLQALYSTLAIPDPKTGRVLSASTITHVHRVLHRAFRDALRWGLVGRNVCDLVSPPRAVRAEIQALGPEDARHLLKTAEGDPLEALYVLAITSGLRQGELLGLKWTDVDLDAGHLQVRRTIRRVSTTGFQESEPKSARSRRNITLTALAVAAITAHKDRQGFARKAAVEGLWEEHGFVFCNAYGRPIEAQNLLKRSYHPLIQRAGLPPMTFHALRHSAATLLLAAGTHPKVVQEMLGHSSIALTLDTYSHLIPSLQADAAARMQSILTDAAES